MLPTNNAVLDSEERDLQWPAIATEQLHAKCGIYTRTAAAEKLLDWVHWRSDKDLSRSRLLEPSCGNGAILVPAVQRLCESLTQHGTQLTKGALLPRLVAFEIHPGEAHKARSAVVEVLSRFGLSNSDAATISRAWIKTSDFLLTPVGNETFTHVVANPPYIRWSSLPRIVARKYASMLPSHVARGDLSLAFLDRILAWSAIGATIGLLSSDRWLYSAYAETFRAASSASFVLERHEEADSTTVFNERVYAYPGLFLLRRVNASSHGGSEYSRPNSASSLYLRWAARFSTLGSSGCAIKVGPALGCDKAFLLDSTSIDNVEAARRFPYVGPQDLRGDQISWAGRHVISVHDDSRLIELGSHPRTASHLRAFREQLSRRSCVRATPKAWFRTINRVALRDWEGVKLLVPELSRRVRVAIDRNGMIPSHGMYAIFPGEWPPDVLRAVLASGVLGATLNAIAPRVNGGYIRCYKKFLMRVPIPLWSELSPRLKNDLFSASTTGDTARAHRLIARLYGVDGDQLSEYSTSSWLEDLGRKTGAAGYP